MTLPKSVLVVAALAGCGLTSNTVQCEDGRTCPEATACADEFDLCVLPEQLTQCEGKPDRLQCDVAGALGACHGEVCLPATCGNNRVDLEMAVACALAGPCLPYEVCDDGDNRDGDGCSGNCLSTETCGNLVVDAIKGETCDDGNRLDHDGCSSACETEAVRWVSVTDPGPLSQTHAVFDAARGKVVMFGGRVVDGGILANRTNAVAEWDGLWHGNIFAPGPIALGPDGFNDTMGTFGMAYDGEHALTWVAGGMGNSAPIVDTWAWDGARWTPGPDMITALKKHAMAYDAKRKRLVVFGGQYYDGVGDRISGDTYELFFDADGAAHWIKATPATSPPARSDAGMAYDPKRGVIVMFGGDGNGMTEGYELWEYDGATWTKRLQEDTVNGTVPSMVGPALAFDSVNGVIVIYGVNTTNEMYTWNGTQLAKFTGALPTANASPRYSAVLVPDGNRRLMLYGGHSAASSSPLLTTGLMWFYDGSTWTQAERPSAVGGAGVVNVSDRGAVVRFGGSTNFQGPGTSETWELSRRGWTRFASGNPPGLVFTQLAYDDSRQQVLMFGGTTDGGAAGVVTNETWTRSGTTWLRRTPTTTWPRARGFHALAHDGIRHETLLFGGLDQGNAALGDTWVWSGTTWLPRTPAHSPGPRVGSAMGFDYGAGVVVLFGGLGGASSADTWIWDGTDWHDVTNPLAQSPTTRGGATLTWNPARRCLVLSQGLFASVFETWEWRMTPASPLTGTWSRVPTAVVPSPPPALAAAFSTRDGSGISLLQGFGTDELWELRYDGPAPLDGCTVARDSDGDGLVACDDPDCWRACTPLCPPGTTCDAAEPHCGDAVCSTVENCRICPQDCVTCGDIRCGDFVCDPGETCPGDCP